MINFNKKLIFVVFSLLTHFSASATIITSDLTVEGSIALVWIDQTSGVWITPDTTFTGNMSVGANASQVNPSATPGMLNVIGGSTSNVAITDTDQKLSFNTDLISITPDPNVFEIVALDFSMYVENTHATDTFELDFGFDFFNRTETSAIPGFGGFSRSLISLYDYSGEFFYSDILSDADFGNIHNGLFPGFGGTLEDLGNVDFSYSLLAGESLTITGVLEASFGGGFLPVYQSSNGTFGLNDVRQIQVGQPPTTVPEPSSFILFLSILILSIRSKIKSVQK
jgi:hypothetical protein